MKSLDNSRSPDLLFKRRVLKLDIDGTSLPRLVVVTDENLLICLTTGGVTRSIMMDRVERVSLSTVAETTAKLARQENRDGLRSAEGALGEAVSTTQVAQEYRDKVSPAETSSVSQSAKNELENWESMAILGIAQELPVALQFFLERDGEEFVAALRESTHTKAVVFNIPGEASPSNTPPRRQEPTETRVLERPEVETNPTPRPPATAAHLDDMAVTTNVAETVKSSFAEEEYLLGHSTSLKYDTSMTASSLPSPPMSLSPSVDEGPGDPPVSPFEPLNTILSSEEQQPIPYDTTTDSSYSSAAETPKMEVIADAESHGYQKNPTPSLSGTSTPLLGWDAECTEKEISCTVVDDGAWPNRSTDDFNQTAESTPASLKAVPQRTVPPPPPPPLSAFEAEPEEGSVSAESIVQRDRRPEVVGASSLPQDSTIPSTGAMEYRARRVPPVSPPLEDAAVHAEEGVSTTRLQQTLEAQEALLLELRNAKADLQNRTAALKICEEECQHWRAAFYRAQAEVNECKDQMADDLRKLEQRQKEQHQKELDAVRYAFEEYNASATEVIEKLRVELRDSSAQWQHERRTLNYHLDELQNRYNAVLSGTVNSKVSNGELGISDLGDSLRRPAPSQIPLKEQNGGNDMELRQRVQEKLDSYAAQRLAQQRDNGRRGQAIDTPHRNRYIDPVRPWPTPPQHRSGPTAHSVIQWDLSPTSPSASKPMFFNRQQLFDDDAQLIARTPSPAQCGIPQPTQTIHSSSSVLEPIPSRCCGDCSPSTAYKWSASNASFSASSPAPRDLKNSTIQTPDPRTLLRVETEYTRRGDYA